jgi:4-hydroxyproline epimerase
MAGYKPAPRPNRTFVGRFLEIRPTLVIDRAILCFTGTVVVLECNSMARDFVVRMKTIEFIDSHTGGEPTRAVVAGVPDLGNGTMADRARVFSTREDWLRTALIFEPRGNEWTVGALLQEPHESDCSAGIIFFNNVKVLGMCGHGLIGVVATLAHQGRLASGEHRFDTPVGVVSAVLNDDGAVSITNVPSYRFRKAVSVEVPDVGLVVGDIAWGGNWFFLTAVDSLCSSDLASLSLRAKRIRAALDAQQITGENGGEIDHVELFGPPSDTSKADSRNFVLCPGGEYDRSPCGTGTSAKLACLAADELLRPGEIWTQESIIGSVFEGSYRQHDDKCILPNVTGRAFITGETKCVIDPADPYRFGIELGGNIE